MHHTYSDDNRDRDDDDDADRQLHRRDRPSALTERELVFGANHLGSTMVTLDRTGIGTHHVIFPGRRGVPGRRERERRFSEGLLPHVEVKPAENANTD